MNETTLRQMEEQIDLQVGQIMRSLIQSLDKIDGHGEEQIKQVNNQILQKTGMGDILIQYMLDENGHLINSEDWSIEVAEHIAIKEGVEMTEAHWEIINFVREYYEEYKIAPMIKIIIKALAKKLGSENGNIKHPYKLFSGDNQLTKIAGLQRMGGCV